jgi:signal transduction histidine kinase
MIPKSVDEPSVSYDHRRTAMPQNGNVPPRVLVADANATTRGHLVGMLREGGYNPQETGTAQAAIERIRAGQIDVAILDPDLPDRSGLEIVRATQHGGILEVPLIFCTSSRNVDRAIKFLREGAWDWLTLPFSREKLLETLAEAVQAAHHKGLRFSWKEREERERHAQRLEAYGRLAAGVIHDFNNLLTIIQGFGEMLQKRIPASHDLRGKVDEICRAAGRGHALTQQLLSFGRNGRDEFRDLDLNALVLRAETMLGPLLGSHIRIEPRLSPRLGLIHIDPAQLDQVIVNLAINAKDAMPEGGRLILETANTTIPPTATETNHIPPGDYVLLTVSDTGSGMTEDTRTNLFEPFFTTKSPGQGTGLGLTIVRRIIDQSGGHIRVTSQLGVGTTFAIYWPRVDVDVPPFTDGG